MKRLIILIVAIATLTSPVLASHNIGFYCDKYTVQVGEELKIAINGLVAFKNTSLEVYEVNTDNTLLATIPAIVRDFATNNNAYENGPHVHWDWTMNITIPNNWANKFLMIHLKTKNNMDEYIWPLNVLHKDHSLRTYGPNIVVMHPLQTWQAYNSWGKIHEDTSNGPPFTTHMFKPIKKTDLQDIDLMMYRFLNLRSDLSYRVLMDIDIESSSKCTSIFNNHIINSVDEKITFVIHGHSEYISTKQYKCINELLKDGNRLVYIGGQSLYWKIVYDSTGTKIEAVKDSKKHTVSGHEGEIGGRWRSLWDNDELTDLDSPAAYLGVSYTNDYNCMADPFIVLDEDHWSIGSIKNGTKFASNIVPYNFDCLNGNGASGYRVDIFRDESPCETMRDDIAVGTNEKDDDGNYIGAPITMFPKDEGIVFSVGSLLAPFALVPHTEASNNAPYVLLQNTNDNNIFPNMVHQVFTQFKEKPNSEFIFGQCGRPEDGIYSTCCQRNPWLYWLLLGVLIFFVLMFILICIVALYRYRKDREDSSDYSSEEYDEKYPGANSMMSMGDLSRYESTESSSNDMTCITASVDDLSSLSENEMSSMGESDFSSVDISDDNMNSDSS